MTQEEFVTAIKQVVFDPAVSEEADELHALWTGEVFPYTEPQPE
jgi:hypothetical protein